MGRLESVNWRFFWPISKRANKAELKRRGVAQLLSSTTNPRVEPS
jgi:hypothetical protein